MPTDSANVQATKIAEITTQFCVSAELAQERHICGRWRIKTLCRSMSAQHRQHLDLQ